VRRVWMSGANVIALTTIGNRLAARLLAVARASGLVIQFRLSERPETAPC